LVLNSLLRTESFGSWLLRLKDPLGKARIIERIRSAERGNFGDVQSIGSGISEMRVHVGPGYRIYFVRTGPKEFVLLCGGRKREQKRDIAKAKEMADLITGS
jgi:putative addiction module killer protein